MTDRSAVGRKSKNKGRRGEYWLRDRLRAAFGYKFEKTPQSGGSVLKDGWKLAGDICAPPGADWGYGLEMKWREGWRLEQIYSDKCEIWNWWDQAVDDALRMDMIPVLVFKRNNVDPLVMTPSYARGPSYGTVVTILDYPHTRHLPGSTQELAILPFDDWVLGVQSEMYAARKSLKGWEVSLPDVCKYWKEVVSEAKGHEERDQKAKKAKQGDAGAAGPAATTPRTPRGVRRPSKRDPSKKE